MKRRDFLKLTTAGTGAAMAGCTKRDPEKIVSYFVPPESWIPGQPQRFSSVCTECSAQCGLTVKGYDKYSSGRTRWMPVKFEGTAGHPVNDGRLCMRGQAAISRFYLPDRLKQPLQKQGGTHVPVKWEEAFAKIGAALEAARKDRKTNVWLSGRTTGTLSKLIDQTAEKLALERHAEYEPVSYSEIREANRIVFGVADVPRYAVEKAEFLLTVGADVLESFVNPVAFARGIRLATSPDRKDLEKRREDEEARRRRGQPFEDVSLDPEEHPVVRSRPFRWWHIEPHVSLTGANADVRLTVKPGSEALVLAWLVKQLLPGEMSGVVPNVSEDEVYSRVAVQHLDVEGASEKDRTKLALKRLVEYLRGNNVLVIAGGVSTRYASGGASAAVLAALLQRGLKSAGLVDFTRAHNFARVGGVPEARKLAERLKSGEIGVLFVSRANPVGTLPETIPFKESLSGARLRVALSATLDDTAKECDLVLPLSSALESWGDAEPQRGVWSLVEPALFEQTLVQDPQTKRWNSRGREHRVAAPIHDTLSEGEILLKLMGGRENWREVLHREWDRLGIRKALFERGFAEVAAEAAELKETDWASVRDHLKSETILRKPEGLVLFSAPTVRSQEGKGNDLPLLKEIPDPLTTITYGTDIGGGRLGWISVPPDLAKKEGIRNVFDEYDEVQVESAAWKGPVKLGARIQQGLPDGVVVVPAGTLGPIPAVVEQVTLRRTGGTVKMPVLSGSESQQGRGIIPTERPHAHHGLGEKKAEHLDNGMFPPHKHHPYRFGMAVDLEACTGCGACVAACYVENNVPLVGAAEHVKGREMSWLRIEPFYEKGRPEFIPMLCQHCDNAPCEPVCPVFAAYHNPDGLNGQVYNRCVGTRYCSNNCPYKVRRFNWWENSTKLPLVTMANPELSTRPRGVMEKCTFCVQRIRTVKDQAKDTGRVAEDRELVRLTACAQACPSRAIAFGNMVDEQSTVARWSRHGRGYKVFEELNVRPAVTYLHPVEHTS